MERTTYMQKKRKGGFTLAEFLVVIAITTILAGVSFVTAIHYQSRLRRLEMDQTAKEIFLAAQNRLSLEKAGGSLERLLAEYPDPEDPDSEDKLGLTLSSGSEEKQGLYYILYQPGDEGNNDTEDIRQRLLPFGSIDETVRTDGSYAIGYNPKEGTVREVWYSDKYVFQVTDLESEELAQAALSADKREKYHGEAIGYYNGESMTDPEVIPDPKLKKPTLKIFNGDVLYAEVDDYMSPTAQYTMRLWVEGMSSGAKGWIDLMDFSQRQRVISIGTSGVSYVILDDITWEGFRFAGLSQDLKRSDGGKEGKLIPGEDLRVYAEVSNSNGSVISEIKECNSIFQDITENKVLVSSIRHLENLDYRISGFKPEDSGEAIGLTPAEDGSNGYVVSQQEDLSWTDFRTNVVNQIHISHGDNRVVREADKLSVCYATGSGTYTSLKYTQPGCYAPVNPQFVMSYEGNTHKINDLLVNVKGDTLAGGCFGNVTKDLYVKDLKLVRPDITSETSAGALVGFGINIPDRYGDPVKPLNISVENVFVQYPKITATGEKDAASDTEVDAGALVGAFSGTELTISKTMAADTYRTKVAADDAEAEKDLDTAVEATYRIRSQYGVAGGLAGSVSGKLTVSGCVASVYVDGYDFAGGLVGKVVDNKGDQPARIENSYVGGHTSAGKFLVHPTPAEENFDTTQGRYNVISRDTIAGGLAAILPSGSQVERTYVSASVYMHSDVYGTVPAASETDTKMNKANEKQDEAAFVTVYGALNTGSSGKAASDASFRYCYSSSMVNGARSVCYSDTLKNYFEENSQAISKKAFPYDKTLTSTYPMPTVVQLIQADLTTQNMIQEDQNSDSTQPKQIPKFARVHIGDWMEPEKEEPEETGLTLNNGNRLWVDYVFDVPENTGDGTNQQVIQVSFSIEEKPANGEESGKTVYYLLRFDQDFKRLMYTEDIDAAKIEELYNNMFQWWWPWQNVADMGSRRFEVTKEGDSQIKIRFYLDSKEFGAAGFKFLHGSGGAVPEPGDNFWIRASIEHAIPGENDPLQKGNSYFQDLIYNADTKTYTALVSNSRHLINLSFYDTSKLNITNVEQTDNILWNEDPTVTAKTEAYCKELSEAYPDEGVKICNSGNNDKNNPDNGYTQPGSFKSIQNENIRSYDGGGHTIAGLRILPPLSGNESTALFAKNDQLTMKNLNIKDPYIQGGAYGAAVLIDTAGEINDYSDVRDGTYLDLENIRVYGDDIKLQGWGVGGIAVNVGVQKVTMKNVHVYGKNVLIGSASTGSNYGAGGLVGKIKAKELEVTNCSFSGYLSGKHFQHGAGGLIGNLDLSGYVKGPDKEIPLIQNCYVAGRNNDYPDMTAIGDDDQFHAPYNISGYSNVGGLIGEGKGCLKIENSFSMANIFSYMRGNEGSAGGLVGRYDNSSDLTVDTCYFGGKVSRVMQGAGNDPVIGYLIGRTNKTGSGTSETTDATITNCVYRAWDTNDDPIGNIWGSVSGIKSVLDQFRLRATDTQNDNTITYDENLKNQKYPYKIWTKKPDNQTEPYRGDWLN